jgi:hypothetical protein
MLETHIVMSLLIFRLVLFLVLHIISFMDLTIAHLVLVHENNFVPRHFGYGPRSHRGDYPPRRHGFFARRSYTRFELRHLDGPRSTYRG